jgi:hypothetical protein
VAIGDGIELVAYIHRRELGAIGDACGYATRALVAICHTIQLVAIGHAKPYRTYTML